MENPLASLLTQARYNFFILPSLFDKLYNIMKNLQESLKDT